MIIVILFGILFLDILLCDGMWMDSRVKHRGPLFLGIGDVYKL